MATRLVPTRPRIHRRAVPDIPSAPGGWLHPASPLPERPAHDDRTLESAETGPGRRALDEPCLLFAQ